jgi:purine-binding chemotaxis protein CheW
MSNATITETKQYLTFSLEEEFYAIDVGNVQEVLELSPITKIPKTPDYMSGVINVRGSVVPVVDLRSKFDMPSVESTVDTSIVVIEVHTEQDDLTIGVMVDKVEEVVEIAPENIEPTPKIGTRLDTTFIDGMGKYKDNFLIILNVNEVFTSQEVTSMGEATRMGEQKVSNQDESTDSR